MLALLPLALAADAPAQHAARPLRPEAFWVGLDDARPVATAGGVVALDAHPRGAVRVPGGTFIMGSTPTEMVQAIALCRHEIYRAQCENPFIAASFRAEGVAHPVTLAPFFIDRTEVTNEAYARCVAAGVCGAPGFVTGDARFDRPELPIVSVAWDDADAYCRWSHARLPTEAEWEYAARGAQSRMFPWGKVWNGHLANHGAFAHDETDASDGFAYLAPVGSFPDGATPLGILDMAGNASEWVADVYSIDENGFGYAPQSQVDPKGKTSGGNHVIRGGSYLDGAAWLRSATRGETSLARAPSIGFRCARDAS